MRTRWVLATLLILLTPALAGCLDQTPASPADPTETDARPFPACQHPWPCADGSEWPTDLAGPFERLAPEHVTVESFDGTLLDGWIWRPDLPTGALAPVILETDPYMGTCSYQSIASGSLSCRGSGGSPARLETTREYDELIAAGYAVALFNGRGTGGSGGCYDLWGEDEQRDQVALVAWLADQAWSNGRVAMNGVSYSGTTPREAAIHQAPALKAITVGGIVSDAYLGPASPQGAIAQGYDRFRAGTVAANSLQPAAGGGPATVLPYAEVAHERACPEVVDAMTNVFSTQAADDRPAAVFEERRLVSRFGQVEAAVLVAQGFQDASFHRYQEDAIWTTLPNAPKTFLLGQWGHTVAFQEEMATYEHGESWLDITLGWYDFWLKGLGDPPARLGAVDYQASSGEWYRDTAWPPTRARAEVLHLAGERLAPGPAGPARSLDLTPVSDDSLSCADDLADAGAGPPQLHYATDSLDQDLVLAGNPVALLTVTAEEPRGLFGVGLLDASPGWSCETGGKIELLSHGRVDLRFHTGTLQGEDLPTGAPTEVRVDLYNVAHRVPEGHRLLLVLRNGDDLMGQHASSSLAIEPDSHVVLPIQEGTLGGQAPTEEYPPRPFVPAGSG